MELLDIYDKEGIHIGSEDRKVVHEKGLWHKTVHCWLYDSKGNIFFQRRTDRGTLYTTASGHLALGETVKEAFAREINEELGTVIDCENSEFGYIVNYEGSFVKNDGSVFLDKAFANIYFYRYDETNYNFHYDESEILELVKVNAKETLELFRNGTGKVQGEIIKLVNGANEVTNRDIDIEEFLVNPDETLLTKYQDVLEKVIYFIS